MGANHSGLAQLGRLLPGRHLRRRLV